MKKGRKINRVRCDIQSHIIAAGYTQKEAVEACSAEYGWSDSDSNFSAKLSDQTLRYREVLELADVLGYEIVWQKRRENRIHKPARRIPCCKKEHAYSHKKRKLWKSFGEKGAVTWKLFRMMQRNWYRCG